jgi:hypothetical protein
MIDNRTITATVLGWLFPGLGHAYLGRRGKAAFFAAVVVALFAAGVALSGGHSVSWSRAPLWFVGEAFALVPAILGMLVDSLVPWTHVTAQHQVGLLYTTVAGLLNIVVAFDAFGIALAENREKRGR